MRLVVISTLSTIPRHWQLGWSRNLLVVPLAPLQLCEGNSHVVLLLAQTRSFPSQHGWDNGPRLTVAPPALCTVRVDGDL